MTSGIQLIKKSEGFREFAYPDPASDLAKSGSSCSQSLKFAGGFSLQVTLLQLCLKTCKPLMEDLGLAGTAKLKVSHLIPDGAKQRLPAV